MAKIKYVHGCDDTLNPCHIENRLFNQSFALSIFFLQIIHFFQTQSPSNDQYLHISLSFKALPTHFFQLDFRISLRACSKVTIGTSGAEDSAKHFLNKGPSSPHRPIERLRSTLRNGKWRNTKWKSTQLPKYKQKHTNNTIQKKVVRGSGVPLNVCAVLREMESADRDGLLAPSTKPAFYLFLYIFYL